MAPRHVFLSEHSRSALMGVATDDQQERNSPPEKFYQFYTAFTATLSALAMGMCLSWSSAAIPMLEQADSVPQISKSEGAWIGSLITLGAGLGAIPTGSLATLIGPKRTLLFLAVPLYASWIIIAYCDCVRAYLAARFLAGLAIGGISVAAPIYVAEVSHASIRGTLGTFFQMQITIGLLIQYALGGCIDNFKLLAQVSSIFPVIFMAVFVWLPESPVYQLSRGDTDQCRRTLQLLRGVNYDVEEEVSRIGEDIKAGQGNRAGLCDLINGRATRRGLIVSLGLMVFQQLSGINAVLFYTGDIFRDSGSSLSPNASAIILGAVQVVATMVSTVLIDKAGRKILLLLSDLIMCICLIVLGLYFYAKNHTDVSSFNSVPLISVGLFIVMFSIGFGPIPWMIMGEIFSSRFKGLASSVSASFNWILAFTVTNQFQNMAKGIGIDVTFIVFGIVCGLGVVFVMLLVPETKGRTQEDIEAILEGQLVGRNGAKNVQSSTTML